MAKVEVVKVEDHQQVEQEIMEQLILVVEEEVQVYLNQIMQMVVLEDQE